MRSRARAGFTLIELLVSMVLTLVIMTILAQAYVMALNTFSGLKGLGDMLQALRTAAVLIRADLSAPHFEGARRDGDPNLIGNPLNLPVISPMAGFFAWKQSSSPSTTAGSPYFQEGQDQNSMYSYTAVDHMLYMTCRRSGNRQESFYTTNLGGTTNVAQGTAYELTPAQYAALTMTDPGCYKSQWAEIAYFLVVNPEAQWALPLDTTGTKTKTYSLYRAQFVMPPDSTKLNAAAIPNAQFANFQGMSCDKGATTLKFFSPADAATGLRTIPTNTLDNMALPVNPNSAIGTRLMSSSTLVLSNVISFQVRATHLYSSITHFVDLPSGRTPAFLYDTTQLEQGNAPDDYRFKAFQVTLRVWDVNTRQTRQVTITQEI